MGPRSPDGAVQEGRRRYFVSMGVHHDNFDLWNSHYQRWNAVQMGPHRDVVGTWQKAAKKQGLRFGVTGIRLVCQSKPANYKGRFDQSTPRPVLSYATSVSRKVMVMGWRLCNGC